MTKKSIKEIAAVQPTPVELTIAQHGAWHTFLATHAVLVERINRRLIGEELLPLEWYDVLLSLDKAPDQRLRMSELAAAVLLSRSGLTRLVDRLEAAGLLRREHCRTDRRGSFAVLTEAGTASLRQTWPEYSRGIFEQFGSHLSDAEATQLTELLMRMLSAEVER